jgi:hypothetical protein
MALVFQHAALAAAQSVGSVQDPARLPKPGHRNHLREYEAAEDMCEDAKRRSVKRALRVIGKGKVPFAWDERYGATDILAPIPTQFDAAIEKAFKEANQEHRSRRPGRSGRRR